MKTSYNKWVLALQTGLSFSYSKRESICWFFFSPLDLRALLCFLSCLFFLALIRPAFCPWKKCVFLTVHCSRGCWSIYNKVDIWSASPDLYSCHCFQGCFICPLKILFYTIFRSSFFTPWFWWGILTWNGSQTILLTSRKLNIFVMLLCSQYSCVIVRATRRHCKMAMGGRKAEVRDVNLWICCLR